VARLHPEVRRIAESVVFEEGRADIPDTTLREIAARLKAQPAQLREPLAMDLAVVAQRMLFAAPLASTQAVGKLVALAALLLGSADRAAELFTGAGVDSSTARRALGLSSPDWHAVARAEKSDRAPGLLGLLGKKEP